MSTQPPTFDSLRRRVRRLSGHPLDTLLNDQLRILARIDEDPPDFYAPDDPMRAFNGELTSWERTHLAEQLAAWLDVIEANLDEASHPPMRFDVREFGAAGDGRTDDGPAIGRAIEAVRAAGGPAIVHFAAGRYRLELPEGAEAHWTLHGLQNLTLEGEPGTEILGAAAASLLRLENCHNVRVRDLAFDYDPPLFTQGTIREISADRRELVVVFDEGLPLPTGDLLGDRPDAFNLVLGADQRFVHGSHGGLPGHWTALDGRTWKLTLEGAVDPPPHIAPGLKILRYLRARNVQAVEIRRSAWIDFERVEIWGASQFALFCESCTGVTLRHTSIQPKPGSGRLGGLNADGMHFRSNRYGPMLENCRIVRVLDDCLNIQTRMASVDVVRDERVVTLDVAWHRRRRPGRWSPTRDDFRPGDQLLFLCPTTGSPAGWARIIETAAADWRGHELLAARLDRPVRALVSRDSLGKTGPVAFSSEFLHLRGSEPIEHFAVNVHTKSDGFVIRGCELGHNTVTAGKIKAGNGLIVRNRTFDHGWCVWSFATETLWQEGYAIRRVLVEDNDFDNWFGIFVGSQWPFGRCHLGEPLNYRLEIVNNRFMGVVPNEFALDLHGVIGCRIDGNTFTAGRPIAVGPSARHVELSRSVSR